DDTLVRFGLSFSELTDNLIQVLESGAEEHAHLKGRMPDPLQPHLAVASFVDRLDEAGVISDLRREATRMVERLVRLLTLRLAESQGRGPTGQATGTHPSQGRGGVV